jgi:hypothetical protein
MPGSGVAVSLEPFAHPQLEHRDHAVFDREGVPLRVISGLSPWSYMTKSRPSNG